MDEPTADAASRSSGGLITQLSVMMFLQYWPLGLWAVTVATYIGEHTGDGKLFSSGFVGYSQAANALGAFVTPTLFGWLADRYVPAERLMSLLHVGVAASLWWMTEATSQLAFFAAMTLCFQCYAPTTALSNTIALRRLADSQKEFPAVRLFGTVGWIAAGVFVGTIFPWFSGGSIEATVVPMQIAMVSGLIMAAFCLALPSTRPEPRSAHRDKSAKGGLYRNRAFVLFLVVSFVAAIPTPYYWYANWFMNRLGYQGAAATLTFGQMSEVVCLGAMPFLLRHVRLKTLFLIGVLSWATRFALLAAATLGGPESAAFIPLFLAIIIHGPAYVFVYLAGHMYVDRLVDPSNRGAAQGLHTFAMFGLGHLCGSGLMGWSESVFLTPEGVTPPPYRWGPFWLMPVSMTVGVAMLYGLSFFRRSRLLSNGKRADEAE